MKKVVLLLTVVSLFAMLVFANELPAPELKMPVVVTSAGQGAEVETVTYVADEVGLKYDYCDVLSKEEFLAGVGLGGAQSGIGKHVTVLSAEPEGTGFQTVILVLGASLKGMGASGLSVDSEAARLKAVAEAAVEKKAVIVVIAIGGEIRRGLPGSPNEVMIDTVAPYANFIITTQDTNLDGRFTKIADEKQIPLKEIESAFDLLDAFSEVFGL